MRKKFFITETLILAADNCQALQAACLAVDAGKCLFLDGDKLVVAADNAGITLVPQAPSTEAECYCRVESSHVSSFPVDHIDQEDEWQQFKETYGLMTEDELSAVAEDAYDLTPTAREVLQAEIAARGLDIQLRTTPGVTPPDIDAGDLVWVYQLWDEYEANQAKSILDAASIPSFLGPENIARLEDFKSTFENGVDLKVPAAMEEDALALLEQIDPGEEDDDEEDDNEEEDLPGDGKGYVVICPKCQSQDIIFDELNQGDAPNDAAFNWRCADCNHRWKDDGIEQKL